MCWVRERDTLRLRFHGRRKNGGKCTLMPVMLQYSERIDPPLNDPFVILVIQPDGPPLVRSVNIE
jgi:hypothetical protein